jgi:hypothetical protein
MTARSDDGVPAPLPRDWLPDPQPPEGDALWDARARRILAAARPELRRLERTARQDEASAWLVMARWWRPAGVLAAAASALLVLAGLPTRARAPTPSAGVLGLVASDGDPVSLWRAAGVPADPFLARMAIHDPPLSNPSGTPGLTEPQETR